MATLEKRKFLRVSAAMKVRYRVLKGDNFQFIDGTGTSSNLSLGGLGLEASSPLAKDELLRVEILSGLPKPVKAYAEVIWAEGGKAGLKFLGVLDPDMERIGGLIEEARLKG